MSDACVHASKPSFQSLQILRCDSAFVELTLDACLTLPTNMLTLSWLDP
jgi:hypothetical protein